MVLRLGRKLGILVLCASGMGTLFGCGLIDECTTDADCDDGLFCNGQEHCGATHFLGTPFNTPRHCLSGFNSCTPHDYLLGYGEETHLSREEACNEDEDRCEAGNECTNDADCEVGNFCGDRFSCFNGFCYSPHSKQLHFSDGISLTDCVSACTADGYPRVSVYYEDPNPVIWCKCTCAETSTYHRGWDHICGPDGRTCDAVCAESGWDISLGPHPDFPDCCTCAMSP